MKRNEIITELKKYFGIKELVCNHTLAAFGEKSWQFLNTELLETLLVLRRDIFKVATNVNYGSMTQRGLRCNLCQLVKEKSSKNQIYLSSHCVGGGLDIDFKGFTAEQSREIIRKNADKLPYPVRLEKDVTWVHIDIYNDVSGKKIVEFNG
jgi:hypothetical protein